MDLHIHRTCELAIGMIGFGALSIVPAVLFAARRWRIAGGVAVGLVLAHGVAVAVVYGADAFEQAAVGVLLVGPPILSVGALVAGFLRGP